MKRTECIAITRIISDLIKADSIIDVGEMDMYVRLQDKYGIQKSDERAALQMPLSEAMAVMSRAGVRLRKLNEFLDCKDKVREFFMTMSYIDSMKAMTQGNNEKVVYMPFESSKILTSLGFASSVMDGANTENDFFGR